MLLSVAIIAKPIRNGNLLEKGVIISNQCDRLLKIIPSVKNFFFIVERRGWFGISEEQSADIKLVDELATLEKTRQLFPNAIVLEFANGDFVDTDKFYPLDKPKKYTGIQIAAWQKFKRHDLFVRASALLLNEKFLKFGHFWIESGGFWDPELRLRTKILRLTHKLRANIDFPFTDKMGNYGLPSSPEEINHIINMAKVGILTSKKEGINRFKMECLSANIPMLVPEDAGSATKRHINKNTGVLFEPTPGKLAEAIRYVIEHYSEFSPREYILENTGCHNALKALKKALRELAERDGSRRQYDEVYWNGRNENLVWGNNNAIKEIEKAMREVI